MEANVVDQKQELNLGFIGLMADDRGFQADLNHNCDVDCIDCVEMPDPCVCDT